MRSFPFATILLKTRSEITYHLPHQLQLIMKISAFQKGTFSCRKIARRVIFTTTGLQNVIFSAGGAVLADASLYNNNNSFCERIYKCLLYQLHSSWTASPNRTRSLKRCRSPFPRDAISNLFKKRSCVYFPKVCMSIKFYIFRKYSVSQRA